MIYTYNISRIIQRRFKKRYFPCELVRFYINLNWPQKTNLDEYRVHANIV
jgi:hypothetical protein